MTQLMHVTEHVLQGNNLAVYSGFRMGLVCTRKALHDLCLHNVRVWEMFHVLLNPFEILNSASFVFVLIPRKMENPQGDDQANNADEGFLGILGDSSYRTSFSLIHCRLENKDRYGAPLRPEKQRSLEKRENPKRKKKKERKKEKI